MKILQITDLHFGAHNATLAATLKTRVASIQPDVILATGDLSNDPKEDLFKQALSFLKDLERSCRPSGNAGRPRVMAIPGNHDIWYKGVLPSPFRTTYERVFGHFETHYYFQPERLWIYGFNSAQEKALATGEVNAGRAGGISQRI